MDGSTRMLPLSAGALTALPGKCARIPRTPQPDAPTAMPCREGFDLCRWAQPLALLVLAGCLGARGDIELVEARLRQQQDLAERYARDLSTAQSERDAARREADLLRRQLADAGAQPLPAEFTESLFRVRGIEFNSLMTGGRDRDGKAGHDVLVAVLAPRDEHGDLVKIPGAIELEALDLNRPEGERQLGKWTFSPQETRALWKSGAFSAGYQLEVPWTGQPGAEKIILHARLSTADGRQFDATHTVKLKPEAAASTAKSSPGTRAQPPAPGVPGKATLTNALHEEFQPVSTERVPRPASTPLASEPIPSVPSPSPDAFTPPESGAPRAANSGDGADAPSTEAKPQDADQPRPFPDGLKTSDVWTDATIPFLR